MVEYLFYKLERFRPEGGNHVNSQVKYWCEIIPSQVHPYTDDNPYRLFGQIASLFELGDTIRTLVKSEIIATNVGQLEVELKEPLSHDELRILSVQVLEELGKKVAPQS